MPHTRTRTSEIPHRASFLQVTVCVFTMHASEIIAINHSFDPIYCTISHHLITFIHVHAISSPVISCFSSYCSEHNADNDFQPKDNLSRIKIFQFFLFFYFFRSRSGFLHLGIVCANYLMKYTQSSKYWKY